MDITTPEEILKKHLDIIPTRLTETTEAYVLAAMREYGELKQSPEELVNGNIDSLLFEFKRQGFDTSNWDGDEGWEKAIVDGVRSHIAQQHEELDALYDKALDLSVQQTMEARAKQSPRWVKASERKPEKAGKYFFKLDGKPAGVTEYSLSNILIGGVLDAERVEWLDESGSPEPEANYLPSVQNDSSPFASHSSTSGNTDEQKGILPPTNKEYVSTFGYSYPRPSNRLDLMSPGERAIFSAMQEVEKIGASPELTNVVNVLNSANSLLYNYYMYFHEKNSNRAPDESESPKEEAMEWVGLLIKQIAELEKYEGKLELVKDFPLSGSIVLRFKKNSYWLKIEKQSTVCTDDL